MDSADPLWEYNAPQFVDFTKHVDDDSADKYFDVDHEMHEMEFDDYRCGVDDTIKLLDSSKDCKSPGVVDMETDDLIQKQSHNKAATKNLNTSATKYVCDNYETDMSAYEDALTELSCTRTPVLPVRTRATPLRRSARKNKISSPDGGLALSDATISTDVCSSTKRRKSNLKIVSEIVETSPCRVSETTTGQVSRAEVQNSKQAEGPLEINEDIRLSRSARKSASRAAAAQGPCLTLRSRARSLDRINTSTDTADKIGSISVVSSAASCQDLTSSKTRCHSQDRDSIKKISSSSEKCNTKSKSTMKLTIPQTPQFLKRELKFLHVAPVQSSEDQEMTKIREMRRALADKRRLAEESRLKALTAPSKPGPMKSAPPLTEPLGFHFATDERLKVHEMETRQDVAMYKEVDFTCDLRHYAPTTTTTTGPKHATRPHPFNLETDRKRKLSESDRPCEKFESVAEKVIKFCTQTPDRFRRRSPACDASLDRQHGSAGKQLTVPKTPNLETRKRSRPASVITQAEREEMELEEAKRHQFHANPVNPKVLANSMLGIKKVVPRECTVPEPIHLETEERIKLRKLNEADQLVENVYEFRARPVPKAILEGPVGVQPPKQIPLTVPQSPPFAPKRAIHVNVSKEPEELQPVRYKLRAVPHVGIPFRPRFDHRATEVKPFSFDERDKEMFVKKEEKIQKVYVEEKKAREFHAQPIKDLTPKLPPKKSIPLTAPEPFDLEVDVRGAAKAEERRKQLDEEEQKMKKLATFKARPPVVLTREPYVPLKSTRPLTEILDLQLNTERRAETRLEFEKWRHEKEMEAVEERVTRERQRQIDELNEVKRQRAEAVHKANPIHYYRPVEVVPSSQPLTQPESPRFSERLRTKTHIRN